VSDDSELRGSTPIYTAKDVLVSLDRKVGEMDLKVDGVHTAIQILISQNLNERVVALEKNSGMSQETARLAQRHEAVLQQLSGVLIFVKALLGTSVIGLLLAVVGILKAFNVI
jgi:hypothetical protein